MFPTFESFAQVMDQCTENYECLVINNNAKSNKLQDQIFWYKAETTLISARVERVLAYIQNIDSDDDEEMYDPAKGGKRSTDRVLTLKEKSMVVLIRQCLSKHES